MRRSCSRARPVRVRTHMRRVPRGGRTTVHTHCRHKPKR